MGTIWLPFFKPTGTYFTHCSQKLSCRIIKNYNTIERMPTETVEILCTEKDTIELILS